MTLSDERRTALRAICDTVVARIERSDDPDGFWARTASDVGVPQALEEMLDLIPEAEREGLFQMLDGLGAQSFERLSQRSREQLLDNLTLLGSQTAIGVGSFVSLILYLAYGLPDETGQNPFWKTFGYPGPVSAPPAREPELTPLAIDGDTELEADVVIVGSGAGGGVIAGTLAQAGAKVVVIEAGEHLTGADFLMLELPAFQRSYWRGGPQPTADRNITLQAGFALGGGTTINWTNCLRTKDWVREEWASEHGLEGVDGPEYDRHLDHVLERISATDACSDLNGPQQRMREGAEKLGWNFRTIVRNTDPESYDPATAGFLGFGDQSGSKQSTVKTFLRDAADAGTDVLVQTWAEKVLVEGGRAAGVEAVHVSGAKVTVRAPNVVVACGSLESPALLMRSGIGGPAVGRNLRLHPCSAIFGVYPEDQKAWWGAPHTGLVDEFDNVEDGHGWLIEGVQYTTGLTGSALPWTGAEAHKTMMSRVRNGATFINLLRDHGSGSVTIDAAGQAVPWYSLDDDLDVRNARRAIAESVRLHAAAGAMEIYGMAAGLPAWRWGDDLEAYIATLQRVPLRVGGFRLFSAHQMGSCRMGTDPNTSVAGPRGELHDTPGVWIGDGSAFPTASGTNPMVSIMALAHRTAEAIAAEAGAKVGAGAAG